MQTRAERTHYTETSLHADVMAFYAGLGDPRLHVATFGASPGGRELPLVVLSAHGIRTPAESRRRGLPVVLVICGIHAGEVEGKEAMMMMARDILAGPHAHLVEHHLGIDRTRGDRRDPAMQLVAGRDLRAFDVQVVEERDHRGREALGQAHARSQAAG